MSRNPAARGDAFWWISGIVLALVTGLLLSWCYWEELRGHRESLSTTIRNVGLVIGGALAILFAVWRSIVAEKQAATAQRGLLNERYQRGAEMLGSKVLQVRLGGIYALGCLAREHPRDYHRQIMNLLCSFVRNPPAVDEHDTVKKQDTNEVREDVHAVLPLICIRSKLQIEIEEKEFYFNLDLSGADLHGVSLLRVSSLGNSDMEPPPGPSANLERADLARTNLSGAALVFANLKGAHFYDANLEGAFLNGTILAGAHLSGCKGLTQEQIDRATADSDNPPKLESVVDVNTGRPLVWRNASSRRPGKIGPAKASRFGLLMQAICGERGGGEQ